MKLERLASHACENFSIWHFLRPDDHIKNQLMVGQGGIERKSRKQEQSMISLSHFVTAPAALPEVIVDAQFWANLVGLITMFQPF